MWARAGRKISHSGRLRRDWYGGVSKQGISNIQGYKRKEEQNEEVGESHKAEPNGISETEIFNTESVKCTGWG